jgi:hypothetical protein
LLSTHLLLGVRHERVPVGFGNVLLFGVLLFGVLLFGVLLFGVLLFGVLLFALCFSPTFHTCSAHH